jgi:hypothetical protein
MLEEFTFVDSVLQITVFDSAAVRGKFSCKNTPKFTARPELARAAAPTSLIARARPGARSLGSQPSLYTVRDLACLTH